MIILRKVSTELSADNNLVQVDGGLTGDRDGINKVFLTEYRYTPDRITVFYNGQALHSSTDFSQTGDNEITFLYLSPDITDVIKTTYQRASSTDHVDIDLIYNNGVWESSTSVYTSIPSRTRVFVNGIKQDDAYYQVTVNQNKIEVTFDFYTNPNAWVNMEFPVNVGIAIDPQDIDLVYNTGSWETESATYSSLPSYIKVYVNGVKQNDDYYVAVLDSGKIKLIFDFITTENDWINILIIQ